VLLAPTWGQSAIFSVYGGKIIEVLLKTGYHVIVRPHPQSFKSETEMLDQLMQNYPNSEQLEWNRDVDNFDVLRRSDILISDFSGVIFDFALINNKPIIYTNPNFDLGVYDAWWLDTPLWTLSALPRLGRELNAQNMENLKELIDTCIEDNCFAEGRRIVKEETWAYPNEGAVRVVEYLLNKYEELTHAQER
jgi:CDP-glycerol glycerophosphotransferase (TagB/SpsB family)